MNLEALPVIAFAAALVFMTTFFFGPLVANAMSRISLESPARDSENSGEAACDLPPSVELEGKEGRLPAVELPLMDKRRAEELETATFAMG